ncbi:unnamed protein product [Euphydryas editha]|uniref:Uncharacterized protein n=1 Tax=Euphydryas editha TaxID=104508 RepID=A0AAU9UXV0_EUPED|nr:unnamed protein product [Euphydryas editha]
MVKDTGRNPKPLYVEYLSYDYFLNYEDHEIMRFTSIRPDKSNKQVLKDLDENIDKEEDQKIKNKRKASQDNCEVTKKVLRRNIKEKKIIESDIIKRVINKKECGT